MRRIKKAISIIIGVMIVISVFTSCSNVEYINTAEYFINSNTNSNSSAEKLADYNSAYSCIYKNEDDTYSIYLFSSPIQYKTDGDFYEFIDNTLIDSSKEQYAFENKANNIKMYLPKDLTSFFRIEKDSRYIEFKLDTAELDFSEGKKIYHENMYDDTVSAVSYKNDEIELIFYCSFSGIKVEVIQKSNSNLSELDFLINSSATSYRDKSNGYITFEDEQGTMAVISNLVDITSNENPFNSSEILKIKKAEEETYITTFSLADISESNDICITELTFDMYVNSIPDSSVYSEYNQNTFLSSYSVIGNHPSLGEGWEYVRFRFNYMFELEPDTLLESNYYVKNLYGSLENYEVDMFLIPKTWSSIDLNWNLKEDYGKKITQSMQGDSYFIFDIKEYTEYCIKDKFMLLESFGAVLKSDVSRNVFVATSDNSLYSPHLEIRVSDLPVWINSVENINDI